MSENGSLNGDARKRTNLTEYQKHLIVFLHEELHMDIDDIRDHDRLSKCFLFYKSETAFVLILFLLFNFSKGTEDGKKILKKTVCYWINRYKETGDLKVKRNLIFI